MVLTVWSLLHCSEEQLPPLIRNLKGIPHHTTSYGKSVVDNLVLSGHVPARVRLYEVGPEPKYVVPQDKIWYVSVIIRQWMRCWEAYGSILQALLQYRGVMYLSIRYRATTTNVNPEELILRIHQNEKYDREESLVVVIQGSSGVWPSNSNMLAVQGTTSMGNMPSFVEIMCDCPLFCWCR